MLFLLFPSHFFTFFETVVGHVSGSTTGLSPVAVLSRPPSYNIQISPYLLPAADTLLGPRCHFKLAAFSVPTLMRVGQQGYSARALETLVIDVCYTQEIRSVV